jgi:signal transduction histidine kinase
MLTATSLLALVLLRAQAEQLLRVRDFVGRGLLEAANEPAFALGGHEGDIEWWVLSPDTRRKRRLTGSNAPLEEKDWQLAASAVGDGRALVESGAPWQPIRFAVRLGPDVIGVRAGDVALARISPPISGSALAALLLLDSGVFTLLGAHLLRRRVVRPLHRLGEAARSLSAGGLHARVELDGVGEVADLAGAFNEMSEALERRTNALEKAVRDLRQANTQLRQARAGLDRNERLAAVGRLAAGVAHEVGNPMGAILAFLDLAGRDPSLSEQGARHLERAAEQGERVREILRQMLDFSRPPRASRGSVDLRASAEQVIGLVSAQHRYSGISIEIRSEPGLPAVIADESLISQVLLNLLINAADAVANIDEPRIEIRLEKAPRRRRDSDEEIEGEAPSQRRGALDAVECSVVDNGPGVLAEDRCRVFDPFFTTKAPGEGTGLGLANALSLMQELDGVLELVESEAAGDAAWPGAQFRLRLPIALAAAGLQARGEDPEGN